MSFNLRFIVKKNNLPKIGVLWRNQIAEDAKETAENIAEDAREHAPVAPSEFPYSGFLRDSIEASGLTTAAGAPKNRLQALVIVKARFGHFVEFGTINMEAQPFFVPAWKRHYPNFVNRVQDTLDDIPRRMG